MDISILYKDKQLVLCIKPVGVSSEDGGITELLKEALGGEIYCVHRLDMAVGGLMVYARTKNAAAKLSALIADRKLEKQYLAVVQGCPSENEGTMRDLLYKDKTKNKSYVVSRMRKGVKEAELDYETLESKNALSLVRIKLKTGRSHQIRVQFSSRGMPLAGDVKYGSKYRDVPIALWSEALSFPHPATGKPISMTAPPPDLSPWTDFMIEKEI